VAPATPGPVGGIHGGSEGVEALSGLDGIGGGVGGAASAEGLSSWTRRGERMASGASCARAMFIRPKLCSLGGVQLRTVRSWTIRWRNGGHRLASCARARFDWANRHFQLRTVRSWTIRWRNGGHRLASCARARFDWANRHCMASGGAVALHGVGGRWWSVFRGDVWWSAVSLRCPPPEPQSGARAASAASAGSGGGIRVQR